MTEKLVLAVVGLGFGAAFVPIYRSHPSIGRVIIVDADPTRSAQIGLRFGIPAEDCRTDISQVLDDAAVDAVHILTPVPSHTELTVRVMQAGKHCACAVPMATSLEDIDLILQTQQQYGVNYMMMETSVYGREYFELAAAYSSGELGTITLYRGFHVQNLDGFPTYWQGYPPMHYLTHALSPILNLLDTHPVTVSARGSGILTDERRSGDFNNPFPCEVGIFTLAGSSAIADITMAFFQTGRSYIEGFDIYGDRGGLEWSRNHDGPLTRYAMSGPTPPGTDNAWGHVGRGNTVTTSVLEPQDVVDTLTPELRPFTHSGSVRLPGMPAPTRVEAHHGGSHPHLVNEFVNSIVDAREPHVGTVRAAQWSAAGIVAHESALRGGVELEVPTYL